MEKFSKEIIRLNNVPKIVDNIAKKLNSDIINSLRRKGAVIGISGGIDSAVSMALAVKALGPQNVLGIMLPEKDSSPESATLAQKLADQFGVKTLTEDITGALEGFGCYRRRDEAVARVFPEYNPKSYKMKIGVKQSSLNQHLPPVFFVTIVDSQGNEKTKMLPMAEYLQIVASSNFKQRSRMAMLYHHAERLHYAVIGTPNKHEVAQGFFVKYGDSGADVMPIAHLYKTQVYQLADQLGIPKEIIERTPTTDTYPAAQTQEEFFYQLPFREMDLVWYGYENNYDAVEVSQVLGKTKEEIEAVYNNFKRRQKTTDYLRMSPISDY
ncbi:MAG TPA: NAD(+) synthase [Bacteroidales bacterium]|nr:NAD(+) synthase [Bacteroidales bacterium]